MASTQPIQPKNLDDWHSPQSRTDVIDELIHGVGEFGILWLCLAVQHFDIASRHIDISALRRFAISASTIQLRKCLDISGVVIHGRSVD